MICSPGSLPSGRPKTYHDDMHFELWDLDTRNILYDFDTLEEALQAARELTEVNRDRYPELMALARFEDDQRVTWLARGDSLGELMYQRRTV
jgi:hypothetical protein